MRKIFKSFLLIILLLISLLINKNFAFANNDWYTNISFIVTAYYSPLPNQKKYITWSFAWDKRLNWEWHTTASWKPVKPGILAAPTKYPFWTKIYFEWYWVWVVEDRGWAIVKAWVRWHEHDRIDIWMWYWDEWLQRALKWWKRTIKWRVVSRKQKVNLKFAKDILNWLENIKVNPEIHKEEDVKKLQEKFKELWLYTWKVDWKYNSIKKDLINFQIKYKLIPSINDEAAGWFWPKTYTALLRRFWSKEVLIKQDDFLIQETNKKIEIILEAPEIKLNWDNPQKEEVIKVQKLFKKLGLYTWEIDWKFEKIKDIILNIQKEAWIIKNNNDWWAGYFWEKTKAALIIYCENKYDKTNYIPGKKEKNKLDKIITKIKLYINNKSKNNKKLKEKIKSKIENKLVYIKKKTSKIKLKYQIDYILENI
jgi:hypothetical protein